MLELGVAELGVAELGVVEGLDWLRVGELFMVLGLGENDREDLRLKPEDWTIG